MPSVNPIGRKQITPSTEPNGTRKGNRKHSQLTNRKGIPRYDDLVTARMLEQTPTISLPMNTVKKQCTSVEWAIVPTVENPSTKHEMIADRLTEWLDGNFNENNDTWDNLLKLWVNDIVSIDTGALELVPTGGPVSHPETGEMEYWLSELYNLDGMVMSKNLTPKDTIPEPPEPAYYKWGNIPNLRGDMLSAQGVDIDRLVREQNLGRFSHGFRQRAVPFSRDEVVWVEENPQPRTMSAYGFGVVQQVRRWAEILLNQDVSNLQHFSQDEYSKGILNIGIENANELDSFRQYWKDEVRGNTDTKLPTVALDDTAEYIPLQETFKELQYLESQEWYMKLVWFLFGETESEMGATESANVSTSEHDSVQVFFNTTKPRLETIQQAMNNHVLPKKRDYHIVNGELEFRFLFEEHSLIQERQQAKRRDDLQHGVTTANRVLEEEGKEPLPWGDMPPQAVNEFVRAHPEWVAENWGGIEDVPEPVDPDPGGLFSGRPSNTEEGDSGNLNERHVTMQMALENPELVKDEPLRNERGNYPNLNQFVEQGTEAIGQVFKSELGRLEDELDSLFPEQRSKVVDSQKNIPGIDAVLGRVDLKDGLVSAITGVVAGAMQESADFERADVEQEVADRIDDPDVDVGIDFEVEDTFAFERMQRLAASDMVTVSDTVKDKVRDTLVNVQEDGGNVTDATRELRDKIDELSDSHARLVARTEVLDASRHGSQALGESTDLIGGKRWRTTQDGRTRPWHEAMDGTVVSKDGEFQVPSGWQGAPDYQPSDYPRAAFVVGDDQKFNCRCSQQNVLAEDMPEDLRELRDWEGVTVKINLTETQYEAKLSHGRKGESFKAMLERLESEHSVSELTGKSAQSDMETLCSKTTIYNWFDEFGVR